MKYTAYRLYRPAQDINFVDEFDRNSAMSNREFLGSNNDESLNLSQFLYLLKISGRSDDTDLIIYVSKEVLLDIIGREEKLKVITKVPILCGRLGDIYEEQTLKDLYERIHIEERE